MNLKNWIIKKLDGITKDENEECRQQYEKWAVKYLTGKNGEVTPDVEYYHPFENDDICVIRSRIHIGNAKITGLKVAPWCKKVVATELRLKGGK